jgi:hypothetical protein
LPFIIFCAFRLMLSCSLFIPKLKAPSSSTMFFLLKTLLERIYSNFLFVFQCCLHLLPSFFNLGRWFLWILLLIHK